MAADTSTAANTTRSLQRRAVRGGAFVLGARLVIQVFQWSVTFFVARLLLPEDYGMMTTGMLFLDLADLLAEAGVGRALVQKKDLTAADLAQGFTLSLLLSTGLYAVLFVGAGPAAAHLGRPDFAVFLRILSLLLFLVPYRAVTIALLERDLLMGKRSAVQLAGAAVQTVLVLGLALAGAGYWALAGGALAARLIEAAVLAATSGWRPRLARPRRAAAALVRFGMHVSFASVLSFAFNNADFAVLGWLLGPAVLGYYSVAFQLISLPVQKITSTANQVMYPVYCRLQDDRPRLRDWYLRLTAVQSFIALPALAGLALVAADAVPFLLGDRWRPAVLPLQLLCPVGALMVVGAGLPPLFNALGRPDINLRYAAIGAATFPAGFFGAAWAAGSDGDAGLMGVCLVWLTLYPLLIGGFLHFTRHLTGVTFGAVLRSHVPVLAGTGCMTLCVLAVGQALAAAPTAVRLAAVVATGMASYALWMLLTARATILSDLVVAWRDLRGRQAPVD
jgi:O-antigen/teichoic acid export membrane protein